MSGRNRFSELRDRMGPERQESIARKVTALQDRQRFSLDAEQWAAFQDALDAPPRPLPRLAQLLQRSDPFDGGISGE